MSLDGAMAGANMYLEQREKYLDATDKIKKADEKIAAALQKLNAQGVFVNQMGKGPGAPTDAAQGPEQPGKPGKPGPAEKPPEWNKTGAQVLNARENGGAQNIDLSTKTRLGDSRDQAIAKKASGAIDMGITERTAETQAQESGFAMDTRPKLVKPEDLAKTTDQKDKFISKAPDALLNAEQSSTS